MSSNLIANKSTVHSVYHTFSHRIFYIYEKCKNTKRWRTPMQRKQMLVQCISSKSKCLHRIRTFNINLSKVYPLCLVCSFALCAVERFISVPCLLSMLPIDCVSEHRLHEFSFIWSCCNSFWCSCRYNGCCAMAESMNINLNNYIASVSFSSLSFLIGCFVGKMLPPCEMAFLNGQGELQTIVG